MSRSGRACQLLSQWRDHPRGCKETHGFQDGYDGPCTDDSWDVAQSLDMIDPFFRQDTTDRLRKVLELAAPAALAAYDAWHQSPPWDKDPAGPPLDVWSATHALMWQEQWALLYPEAQQAAIVRVRQALVLHALKEGATVTGFSEPKGQPVPGHPESAPPMLVIEATGWRVRPEAVPKS